MLHRKIKSFVLRQGKITKGQQNAIDTLMPIFGVEYTTSHVDLNQIFNSANNKIIEIGFGMGDATWQIAKQNPENDYLGIEVHGPGVGSLLMSIQEHQIHNLRIIKHDAVEVLQDMITDHSIHGFHIYFPDPWHKKRHHKRRLIQGEFVELLVSKLLPQGYIHVATDWEDYAYWILDILNKNDKLKNIGVDFIPKPDYRPYTKFEKRGIGLGHKTWDIYFKVK